MGRRLLRKILAPKREKIIRSYRKFHNEKLHDLYFSPSNIAYNGYNKAFIKWTRYLARMLKTCIHFSYEET